MTVRSLLAFASFTDIQVSLMMTLVDMMIHNIGIFVETKWSLFVLRYPVPYWFLRLAIVYKIALSPCNWFLNYSRRWTVGFILLRTRKNAINYRRSIICLSLWLRQVNDLLATDKSRYFVHTRSVVAKCSRLWPSFIFAKKVSSIPSNSIYFLWTFYC